MKLYQLKTAIGNQKLYIAANTNIEALATYFIVFSYSFDDLEYSDEIIEIPEEQWEKIVIKREDGEQKTAFEEMIDRKYAEVLL